MKKANMLYISMTPREQWEGMGYLLLQLTLLPPVILAVTRGNLFTGNLIFYSVNFLAAVLIFRGFLRKTLEDVHGRWKSILGKVLLGILLSRVLTVLMNDLLFYFFPNYYEWTLTGPRFLNANDESVAAMAREHYLPVLISTVLLVPPAEELLHRGLVFGKLYEKFPFLAYLVSATLFCGVHMIGLVGQQPVSFLVISFLQYFPTAVFLAWFYASTESILTPILMHMALNAWGMYLLR